MEYPYMESREGSHNLRLSRHIWSQLLVCTLDRPGTVNIISINGSELSIVYEMGDNR